MRRRSILRPAATAALAITAACARHRTGAAAGGTPSAADSARALATRTIDVLIENHNFNDVDIGVQTAGGQVQRMGTVAGNAKKQLGFRASYAAASQSLQLVAHLVGARDNFYSERFTVQAGQRVVWSLENGLTRSTIAIY